MRDENTGGVRPPGEEQPFSQDADDEAPVILPLDGAQGAARASQWRWGLRLGGLVAVVVLAIVVVVTLAPVIPRPATPAGQPDYLALALPSELRFCATNGYWSPDGQRIAVPRAPSCGSGGVGVSNLPDIYIFDALNGEPITAYSIMPTISDALAQAGLSGAQVSYSGVTWAPDQRALVAQFVVAQALPQGARGTYIRERAGVALVSLAGPHTGAVSALISARGLSMASEGIGFAPGLLAVDEWDIRHLSARQLDLPATLAYEWLPGDLLIGAPPASSGAKGDANTLTEVSDQTSNFPGGQRVSMWRTGYLAQVNAMDCEQSSGEAPKTPYTALYLSSPAWSPDGRYLLTITLVAQAPVSLPPTAGASRPPFCLSGAAASAFPLAPIHDRAMRAALGLIGGGVTSMKLLWSPDGARLAALPSQNSQASNAITIYDTATGATLARISAGPSQIPGAQGSDADARFINASWSPDGRRLLAVVEGQRFNIRLYGPRALG
jgi:hypothetical protein